MNEEQKNKDFIQVYREHVDDIARLAGENYTAYKLFMLLCKHMDGTNALCASYQVLTEILVVSASTLKRAVKYLKKMDGSVFLKAERQMFILLIQKLHGQVMEVKNNTVNSKQMYC